MNYDYFHSKSRAFLAMAFVYIGKNQYKDALWCCWVASDIENRGILSLIETTIVTQQKNNLMQWEIDRLVNWIKTKL